MTDQPPAQDSANLPSINEDWAATIVGLVLLLLVLGGVITKSMLP